MIKLKETDSVVKMNAQKRCNECKDKKRASPKWENSFVKIYYITDSNIKAFG